MQKYFIFFVLMVLSKMACAQYSPTPNLYVYHPTWINPAFTGHQFNHAMSLYGATPVTDFTATDFSTGAMYEGYLAGLSSGVGLHVNYTGGYFVSTFQAGALYSYHFQISEQQRFAAGTRISYHRFTADYSNLYPVGSNEPLAGKVPADNMDADLGFLYQFSQVDIGFGIQNILASRYTSQHFTTNNTRSYTGYVAYHTLAQQGFSMHPSVAVTKFSGIVNADLNAIIHFNDIAFLGTTLSVWNGSYSDSRGVSYQWKFHGGASIMQAADLWLLYLPGNTYYGASRLELMLRLKLGKHDS